jgi:hypothetical protein
MRALLFNQRHQSITIGHINDMGTMRYLMAWRIVVTIHRNYLNPQALQGNDDLLT